MSEASTTAAANARERLLAKKPYVKAVGPRLRRLLIFILMLLALLAANGMYLFGVTVMSWATGQSYESAFYLYMFIGHLGLGLLLGVPFVVFGVIHMLNTRGRKNRRAIRAGYALFAVGLLALVSGVLLMRLEGLFELKDASARSIVYWLHVITPLGAGWLYWLHRLAGPKIKWRIGLTYAAVAGSVVAAMLLMHSHDPREWNVVGPEEGEAYFKPSLARTSSGAFISEESLMMDSYCMKCHQDAYDGWFHSAHHLSSFNNPAYLASVRETRTVALRRDGNVQASRWCAGCHDPVPFFSGKFSDPQYDLVNDPSAHAGITCTSCHAVTHVNSTRGNADYTIEEPVHYPFAYRTNPVLQYINQQLVKAKPSFHKKTFLKPLHRTAEFCSTCHKVSLPHELNHYKEFLRGQNHYDTYLLSGVSGHGARSFYYPPKASENCSTCHMPAQQSGDFGAKLLAGADGNSIHNHLFPAANTALGWLHNEPDVIRAHQDFLRDVVRIDLFGVRDGGNITDPLIAPLRPHVPTLRPGQSYLLEAVIRTLKMGHPFTQGTVDSNEVWVDIVVRSGERIIGRSGGIDDDTSVDPWSHFVNVYMLDKDGNRISRRNPQDIFVPLYNHQIPPGAGQVVHYGLEVPDDVAAPITVTIKLQYRKFDKQYMDFVTSSALPGDRPIRGHTRGEPYRNELPITTLAEDTVTFPVESVDLQPANPNSQIPLWQRWNDYGIGLLLEGQGGARGELRQAAEAFAKVEELGRYDGPLNLARVYQTEGRLDEAVAALDRAVAANNPAAPPWTIAWLTGVVNRQQGHLEAAEQNFRKVLEDSTDEMRERGFDFSLDYEVINLLGETLFDRGKQLRDEARAPERRAFFEQAVAQFEKTLEIDSENVTAHHNLHLLHAQLGNTAKAEEHRRLHARYRPDDNARDRAITLARQKSAAANHAAEALVIYPLHRRGAPELPPEAANEPSETLEAAR